MQNPVHFKKCFLSKIRDKTMIFVLSLLFMLFCKVITYVIGQEEERRLHKGQNLRNKNFLAHMIVCIRKSQGIYINTPKLKTEFSMFVKHKVICKSQPYYYMLALNIWNLK